MKIAKATKKDLPKLAKLMLSEFKKQPFNEKAELAAVKKSLSFFLDIGNAFLALEDGEMIGAVIFKVEQYWEGKVIIIEDVVVKHEFKNKGLGKLLMAQLEKHAKKINAKTIILTTNKKAPAIRFYEHLGYKRRDDLVQFEMIIK